MKFFPLLINRTGKIQARSAKTEPIAERGYASALVSRFDRSELTRSNQLAVIVSNDPIKLGERGQTTVILISPVLKDLSNGIRLRIRRQGRRVKEV